MKIVTAHQPAYLPWLGYFHKIALSDVFIVLDNVQFEKNSFINRNKIKGPNGAFWLTVPVSLQGHLHRKIRKIKIQRTVPWEKKHLKSIENCYRKSAYFDQYMPFFRECYDRKWDTIADLTDHMLGWFLTQLGIDVAVYRMSDCAFDGKKIDLVLQVSKKFNADVFIFGAIGRDYATADTFRSNNVRPYFQDYRHPTYPQRFGDFIPYISVLDLLFNCGPHAADILRTGNVSKKELQALFQKVA